MSGSMGKRMYRGLMGLGCGVLVAVAVVGGMGLYPSVRSDRNLLQSVLGACEQGVVLARFRGDGSVNDTAVSHALQVASGGSVKSLAVAESFNPFTRDVSIHFDPSISVASVVQALERDPSVVYAEPNRFYRADYTPNDPYYDEEYPASGGAVDQWWLRTIDAPKAWDKLRMVRTRLRLGIIDTGVDCSHPDLVDVIARHDDGSIIGRNFVGEGDPTDDNSHGTHCAGIAAADTDNGVGVAGVGFHSFLIVPAKVLSASGSGSWETIAEAIVWCANNGCRVESMSLGGPWYSQTIQDAINYAWSKGVLVVAAAGNSSNSRPHYPASCNHVLAVSATDRMDKIAGFSTTGDCVSVAAPGVNILSTVPTYPCRRIGGQALTTDYDAYSGTSMACPVVAGAASAILALHPDLSAEQVWERIQRTADNVPNTARGGWCKNYGYGRINLDNLVENRVRESTVGSIRGQAVNAEGAAVAGAVVVCDGQSVRTLNDGMFRFANLSIGTHTLNVKSDKHRLDLTVTVRPGCDSIVEAKLPE